MGPSLSLTSGAFGGGITPGPAASLGTAKPASATGTVGVPPTITPGAAASIEDILRLAKAAGFSGMSLQTIAAIGLAESGGRTNAQGDVNIQDAKWGPSVGVWQVRTLKSDKGKGTTRDIDALLADPSKQAKSAWEISGGGQNFKPWSVYTAGKYKSNMGAVQEVMSSKGIGDPVGREEAGSTVPTIISSGGPLIGSMRQAPIVIQNAEFKVEIARGTPEEAERAAAMLMDILTDRDRLLSVGDE